VTSAAVIACLVLALLAAFQLALIVGAPWGRLAWGGDNRVLPTRFRVGSAVSIVLYALFAAVIIDRADLADLIPDGVSRVGIWVLAGYFLIGTGMNLASRSVPERATMTPVAAVLCVACVVVAAA
jgi:hypothetical protein